MRPTNGVRDGLRLGRDVLALARIAVAADPAPTFDEIRCPVEKAVGSFRSLPVSSASDLAALRDVLGGLTELVGVLDDRTAGGAAFSRLGGWPECMQHGATQE